jgi:hypothetical protein
MPPFCIFSSSKFLIYLKKINYQIANLSISSKLRLVKELRIKCEVSLVLQNYKFSLGLQVCLS